MGNTPSSEAPRKPTQKLSKPRAASHGAQPRPQNSTGAAASSSTRISESYLAASIPFSSRDSQCSGDAPQEPYVERLYEPSRRLSRRESDYMRSPVLPESPVTNTRTNSLYANSTASNQTRRASSVTPSNADRPLTRTQSWHGNRVERGTSMQSELLQFYASQQLPRSSSEFLQDLQAAAMNSQLGARQNQSRRHSQSHGPTQDRRASSVAGASLARTTSDLSFYAPVRRRSVIQTPGVATRPRREDRLTIPDRSSSRKSQPVFGDGQYSFKSSSKAPRHLSMPPMSLPPMSVGFAPLERAVTPCESDYKQLGGIKFGSLKIMNGSPPSSPQDKANQPQTASGSEPAPEDSGIELNMARRKNRHTVIGSGAESRALASISGFNLSQKALQTSSPRAKPLVVDELMPSPLSKAPSPLSGFSDVEDNEGVSGKGFGVWRSNSGFASTTSSESSQRTSSKVDSGYSSNVSERSFPSSKSIDDNSYIRPDRARRPTLEQPTLAPLIIADGIKKQGKLYKSPVRVEREREGSAILTNDMAKEAVEIITPYTRPRAKRHEKQHNLAPSSSRSPSRKRDTRTLNTIMSVDNLLASDNVVYSHEVVETDAGVDGSKSLKKRRSLRQVAEAATSRMPSLGLSRRKSAAGNMNSSSKIETEKRKRAVSLVNANRVPYSHPVPAAAVVQAPALLDQQAKSSSLKDRSSAPELRVTIPDKAALNKGIANRSSYSTIGTPSPRTPRPRGIMDSGVPPPIPPQFRQPGFGTSSNNNPSGWPLAQPHRSWDGAQVRRGKSEEAQAVRRSGHVPESPISPRHGQPARGTPPTYRGVRI
ncbi:hypothetical protein V8C35DRAFT_123959 [Trichoderma chlorosporum]